MVLQTFVHLSDLHVHHVPEGQRSYDPRKIFSGTQGHDRRALSALETCLKRRLNFEELASKHKAHLLFTGDLTALGKPPQFVMGSQFFGQRDPSSFVSPALSVSNWDETAIPGNHDHWGKYWWFGPEAEEFHEMFGFKWTSNKPQLLGQKFSVRLIRVDSDCDSCTSKWERMLARPRFGATLNCLHLPARRDREIRVLLLHHSVTHLDEHALPRTCGKLPGYCHVPSSACEQSLVECLIRNEIAVVLTGHIHKPRLRQIVLNGEGRMGSCLEARCGTSAQLPYDSRAIRALKNGLSKLSGANRPKKHLVHTLLVHKLVHTDDEVQWQTTLWARKEGGFTDDLPEVPLEERFASFRVWPWPIESRKPIENQ